MESRIAGATVAVVLCLGLSLLADEASDSQDMDAIQGKWEPEGAVFNSEFAMWSTGVISVSGDKYTLMLGGKPYLYRFKLYPDRKPKEYDVWYLGTPEKRVEPTEQPFGRGIYELNGDVLRRCYSGGNDPRPTKMESPPGKALGLTVHRRARAGNEPAEAEIP